MNVRVALLTVGVIGILGAVAAAEDDRWTQFRGSGNLGVAEEAGLPESWSTTEHVAWVTDSPGLGWSSPIVWEDTLFLTSVITTGTVEAPRGGLYIWGERTPPSDEHRWVVYGIDVATGPITWETEVHRGVPETSHHLKNTFASETPVSDGEQVYAYFGNVCIFSLSLDGDLLWSRRIEPYDTRLGWGTASSSVLPGDRLYIVNDNDNQSYLMALSKETGGQIWRMNRDEGSNWSTPYVWEHALRTELVTTGTDKARSYDLDGHLLWELIGMSSITVPPPFSRFGLLYLSSGSIGDITPAAGGSLDSSIAWFQPQSGSYNTSPIIYGDYYYTLDRGYFTCHDARTGAEVYGKQRIAVGVGFTSSPWAYNGKIFVLSEDADTYVTKAGPEFEILDTNPLDEFTMATPAIAHGSLFIRTVSKLYRFSE